MGRIVKSMPLPAVLVTGGTGVLGSEIVRALSQISSGSFSIVANFHSDQQRAHVLQNATGCELLRADIGDEEQVNTLFDALPPLFAVIHTAGINRDGLLVKQAHADWDATQRANLDGAFLIARRSLEKLQDGGRLIFFTSRVGQIGGAGQTAYAASKAGVLALMQSAAREGATRRLAVNAICPGFVPSSMNNGLSAKALQNARHASVFDEFGGARETASLVHWLLSMEAAAVSGQVFHCHSRL